MQFRFAGNWPGLSDVWGSAVADFNRDGFPDVAVNASWSTVVLRNATVPGASESNFPVAANIPVGSQRPLRVADINRDGLPDLLLENTNSVYSFDIHINTTPVQAENFEFVQNQIPTWEMNDAAFADFDRDGRIDIALAARRWDYDVSAVAHATVILLNRAQLGATSVVFETGLELRTGGPVAEAIAIADFNNDRRPDLAVGEGGNVSVYLNSTKWGDAALSFGERVTFPAGSTIREIGAADFDRDGRVDLVTANSNGWIGSTWTLLRNSTERRAEVAEFSSESRYIGAPHGLAVRDLDRDGYPDLLLSNLFAGSAQGAIEIFHNTSAGREEGISLSWVGNTPAGDNPSSVSVGDFNRDCLPDFVSADQATFHNNTRFEFQLPKVTQDDAVAASKGFGFFPPRPHGCRFKPQIPGVEEGEDDVTAEEAIE